MKTVLRNIVAVVIGLFAGGTLNMAIVMISGKVIPLPEGVNPADIESIKAGLPNYAPKHFLMPFLAHALGAFFGALITALIAASRKLPLAMIIGVLFLLGGIEAVRMLPTAPLWFDVVDLIFAYLPMAFLGYKIGSSFGNQTK